MPGELHESAFGGASTVQWTHRTVPLRRGAVHCVEGGPAAADVTLLFLHGFPECWSAWGRVVPFLARQGFRCVAADLPGYGGSAKLPRVGDYRIESLVGDLAELVPALNPSGRVVPVGHDWGGILAWHLAMWRPELIAKLVILNAPHPLAYRREVSRSDQLLRSWYVLLFQLPWLPEQLVRRKDFAVLRRMFGRSSRTPMDPEHVRRCVEALSDRAALSGAINYYRAAFRHQRETLSKVTTIHTPTLVLWGERDSFLVPGLVEGLEQWVPEVRVEKHPAATHWVHHEEPEWVAARVAAFVR